jgi:multidrug efflux pump subunit AcrA (membrane-fusion protein)
VALNQSHKRHICALPSAQDQHHAHEAELSSLQVALQRALTRAQTAEEEVAVRAPAEELRRVLKPICRRVSETRL